MLPVSLSKCRQDKQDTAWVWVEMQVFNDLLITIQHHIVEKVFQKPKFCQNIGFSTTLILTSADVLEVPVTHQMLRSSLFGDSFTS